KCIAERNVQVAGEALACLPEGCTWQYVESDSAQNACELVVSGDGCQATKKLILPRVIVSCDQDRFVPSWGFCASHENVEVGTVQAADALLMYQLHFPGPNFAPLGMEDPNSSCNTCHFSDDPYLHSAMETDPSQVLASGRINPYIQDLCATLSNFKQTGCNVSGSYLGDPV